MLNVQLQWNTALNQTKQSTTQLKKDYQIQLKLVGVIAMASINLHHIHLLFSPNCFL